MTFTIVTVMSRKFTELEQGVDIYSIPLIFIFLKFSPFVFVILFNFGWYLETKNIVDIPLIVDEIWRQIISLFIAKKKMI